MFFIVVLLIFATAVIVLTKLTIKSVKQYNQEQQRIIKNTGNSSLS